MDLARASPMPPIGEASGNDDGDSEETVEVSNPTNATTNFIQPQQSTVGGGDAAAGRGELRLHMFDSGTESFTVILPFPADRDQLIDQILEGLSPSCVFPSVQRGLFKVTCNAAHELQEDGSWIETEVCGESKSSEENYRRHVIVRHLGGERGGLLRAWLSSEYSTRKILTKILILVQDIDPAPLQRRAGRNIEWSAHAPERKTNDEIADYFLFELESFRIFYYYIPISSFRVRALATRE